MNTIHRTHRVTALPYSMILTKIFRYLEISFHDEVALNPKPTDTINILTLKSMKIIKEDGQWIAKTKEFDAESRSSTLPFEGGEDMDKDNDEEDVPSTSHPRLSLHRPSSSTSGFTFIEDHYNFLNGRIDSLISTVEGLQSMIQQVLASQQVIQSRLDTVFPPPEK
ncbi:Uncharacterized protein Adt_28965 [Abeliophyllum distichum]|uniref:Uncharacterized protein n=1 Tax=Abeliophyllum distichum TaxID=126358 RepID=A0ABD1RY63_9LAMI